MVFQNYALYPHMTVYENMAFGLKLRKVPKDEIDTQGKGSCKDPRPEPPARPEAEGNVRWSETACCYGSCNRP